MGDEMVRICPKHGTPLTADGSCFPCEVAQGEIPEPLAGYKAWATDGVDYCCERFRNRVQSTRDWRDEHEPHNDLGAITQTVEDPGYTIYTLTCQCGAKHYMVSSQKDQE